MIGIATAAQVQTGQTWTYVGPEARFDGHAVEVLSVERQILSAETWIYFRSAETGTAGICLPEHLDSF